MTPEEMTFWKEMIKGLCISWIIGCTILSCGIGSISIKNIFSGKDGKMSDKKFTPGEWGIVGSGDHGFVYVVNNPQKEIQDQHIICHVETNGKFKTIANAALIAAAPEMYNKLKETRTDLWALSQNPLINEAIKGYIESMMRNINDCLKKARGEE